MPQSSPQAKLVTVGTAADILGVSVNTLRFWGKKGLIKTKRHSKNNYRLYSISDLEKFAGRKNLKRHYRDLKKD